MDLSGWKCSRCGGSPKDGDDLMERWGARGFLNHARPSIMREGNEAAVMFRLSDLDGLVCPGCVTQAERGSLHVLPEIGQDYLAKQAM